MKTLKNKIALVIGIASGLVFLLALFLGMNNQLDILPIVLFFFVIMIAVFLLLFNNKKE